MFTAARLRRMLIALFVGVVCGFTTIFGVSFAATIEAVSLTNTLVRIPTKRCPRLSPSGRQLVYLYRKENKELLVLWDIESDTQTAILDFPDPDGRMVWVGWANDSRILLSVEVPMVWATGVRARGRVPSSESSIVAYRSIIDLNLLGLRPSRRSFG